MASRLVIKAERLLRAKKCFSDIQGFGVHELGHLLNRGGAPKLLPELLLGTPELAKKHPHIDRQSHGATFIGNRSGNSFANPPVGVGRKLVATAGVKAINRLDQAQISLLDRILQLQLAIGIFTGDGHHKAQIGGHHPVFGALASPDPSLKELGGQPCFRCPGLERRGNPARTQGEFLLDLVKSAHGLHATGEGDLLLIGEERDAMNGTQMLRESVAAAAVELLWRRHRKDV